jgi:hypothetical protein
VTWRSRRRPSTSTKTCSVATAAAVVGSGRDESEVVEDALRRYLGLEVDQVWARIAENAINPDEALALAYAELSVFRAERDAPAA